MKYRVLFWHTSGSIPKPFLDMLEEDIVDFDGTPTIIKTLDFNEHPLPQIIEALNGLNMMILNKEMVVWIDARNFKQS